MESKKSKHTEIETGAEGERCVGWEGVGQRVQTSSSKTNKFWGRNVQLGDSG